MLTNLTVLAQGITNPALDPSIRSLTGEGFLQNLLPRLIGVAFIIGAVVFLFVMIVGAIQWMTSGGDKAAIEMARGKIINALVGIFILFSLFAVFTLVGEFFGINLLQLDLGPLQVGGGGGGGGGGGCFLAETKISLADGTYKEIQDIKPGDVVFSYNLVSGELTSDEVKAVLVHNNYPGGYLIINENLKVTGNHNLWIVNRSDWERADSLSVGDVLLDSNGDGTQVYSIEWVDGTNTVYNLSLGGNDHNYFVENTLVHNILKI